MRRNDLIGWCRARDACDDAIAWLAELPEAATLADAWERCPRGDWLLWLAARAGVDLRRVVEAACDVAATALAHVPPGEERPARAIAAARAWARGEATEAEVRAAARAAAAYAASAAYAAAARADDYEAAHARHAGIVRARISSSDVAATMGASR